jgi:hypothetical protein
MTENQNYQTPSPGTTDGYVLINQNISSLNSNIEIRDSEATLENYTPKGKQSS